MGKQKNRWDGFHPIAVNKLKVGQTYSKEVYMDNGAILVNAGIPITQKDFERLAPLGVRLAYCAGKLTGELAGGPVQEKPETVTENDKHMNASANVPDGGSGEENRPHGNTQNGETHRPEAGNRGYVGVNVQSTNAGTGGQGTGHRLTMGISGRRSVHNEYMSHIELINSVFLRISRNQNLDSHPVNMISTRLLNCIRTQREEYIGCVLEADVKGYEMAKSAVNIAILSALTAHEIKLSHHKIMHVIVAALLHDSGMLRLPAGILEKKGALNADEKKQMYGHPVISREIVVRGFSYPADVGEMVLQHHERWDGKGYPRRVPGVNISTGARIVSIADSFEAMVSQKPYRSPVIGYQANKNLLSDNSRRFDPDILKVFVLAVGVYPIGSIVRLNNGVVAMVAEVRADTPLRPKLRVLADETGRRPGPAQSGFIDLLSEKKLFIASAVDPGDIDGIDADD